MTILHVIEQEVLSGTKVPRVPDVGLIMSLVSHYTYGSFDDAKQDGYDKTLRYRMKVTVEYEEIPN